MTQSIIQNPNQSTFQLLKSIRMNFQVYSWNLQYIIIQLGSTFIQQTIYNIQKYSITQEKQTLEERKVDNSCNQLQFRAKLKNLCKEKKDQQQLQNFWLQYYSSVNSS
ncbi:hypothetical protein pb186bvf_001167 [Paramecium bursaria]